MFGNRNRGIGGEHLYTNFLSEGHYGIDEVQVQIIDVTDVARPTVRESYWIDKLNCLAALSLNVLNGYLKVDIYVEFF